MSDSLICGLLFRLESLKLLGYQVDLQLEMLKDTKIIIFKGKISNRNTLNSQKLLGFSRDAFQGGDLLLYEDRSQSGMNSLCFFRLRVWCVREEKVLCINYAFLLLSSVYVHFIS